MGYKKRKHSGVPVLQYSQIQAIMGNNQEQVHTRCVTQAEIESHDAPHEPSRH